MIFTHVDDFNMAGTEEFLKEVTERIGEALDISKIEDSRFCFTGIDVERKDGRIEISMDDYAASLMEIEVREGRSD